MYTKLISMQNFLTIIGFAVLIVVSVIMTQKEAKRQKANKRISNYIKTL